MSAQVLYSGGMPPEYIEFRYCPTDPFHWRVDEERCPVCKATIVTKFYMPRQS